MALNQVVNDMTKMKLMDKSGVVSIAVDMSGMRGMVPKMELMPDLCLILFTNWNTEVFQSYLKKPWSRVVCT